MTDGASRAYAVAEDLTVPKNKIQFFRTGVGIGHIVPAGDGDAQGPPSRKMDLMGGNS